ncbi:hypothetical protein D3C72_1951660 [compost metagenome]
MDRLYPAGMVDQGPVGAGAAYGPARGVEAMAGRAAVLERLGIGHDERDAALGLIVIHRRALILTVEERRTAVCATKLVQPRWAPLARPRLNGGTSS